MLTEHETVEDTHIVQTIYRFNSSIPQNFNHAINFRKLRKNALFVEVYNDTSDKLLVEKIADHMACTRRVARGYKLEYDRWVKLYHGELA